MPRVSKVARRRCEGCGHARALILQLVVLRDVYTYRWLCARCRAGTRDEARA